jgi:hypothetical protein
VYSNASTGKRKQHSPPKKKTERRGKVTMYISEFILKAKFNIDSILFLKLSIQMCSIMAIPEKQ